MKKIIIPIVVLTSTTVYSQVGINTVAPKATMDITAKTNDGSKPEGLIAPRLTGDQIRLSNSQFLSAQEGAIIYATSPDSAPAGKTANITAAGYYYFDGSVWQKVNTGVGGGTAGDTTNDAWINLPGNTRVELGTLSNGTTTRPAGTEFVALDNGNVGIGTSAPGTKLNVVSAGDMNGINLNNSTSTNGTRTRLGIGAGSPNWSAIYYTNVSSTVGRFGIGDYITSDEYLSINTGGTNQGNVGIGLNNISPDASAQLDVVATNKGFLPPRVTLTNATSAAPITLPATGLTVYHTGNAALTAGLYTNIGTPAAPNWVAGSGSQDTTNDAWVNDSANSIVKLGTLSNGSTARSAGTEVAANDSGYLGLGTSAPNSRIHIIGTGDTNDDIKINSTASSGGGTGTLLFARSRGTAAVGNGDIQGSILFRGYDGASEIATAGILATTTANATASNVPTDLLFSTGANGFTEKMRVTSAGNVGIGNSTPSNKLRVDVSTDGDGIVLANTASPSNTRTKIGIGAGAPTWGAINYFNTNNTNGRVSLGTYEGAEYLTYNTTGTNIGNIGIGTTSPDVSAQLDVSSSAKGFLPPRLALSATNNKSPLTAASPTAGILIYNTATTTNKPYDVSPGYYYWNGTGWVRLATGSSNSASWAIGEERAFMYSATDASWNTAGSTKTMMTGKAVSNTTTTTSKLLSEAMALSGGDTSGALVMNGLRLDFLRANPRFVNTTSNSIIYSLVSQSTVNAYVTGTKTEIAPNAICYILDGDNNVYYSNNSDAELDSGYIVFTTGEWYYFSVYLLQIDGVAQGYTTAKRLR